MSDSTRTPFRFWLRRDEPGAPRFSVRFDLTEGRGLVRLDRPGVRLDPPARRSGQTTGLAPAAVRSAVFLHVLGQQRVGYALSHLTDAMLTSIRDAEWRRLEVVPALEGGFLELPPEEELPPTQTYRIADLGPVLREAQAARAIDPDEPPAAPRNPRGPVTGLVRHLRREVNRLKVENDALRARIARMEHGGD
jgi:hypothetical protein